ncbi:hypothetical protein Q8A67_023997 [Cirrhinus molitorella]|uniref:Uncharacterized protein n=1 Tax=Cirrhinus molitorella TaxID=172907 RepID=A0AA88P6T6_9TELE|nr:hypothetical protein Q8A67_023997 [Cirrhinus molitorella]
MQVFPGPSLSTRKEKMVGIQPSCSERAYSVSFSQIQRAGQEHLHKDEDITCNATYAVCCISLFKTISFTQKISFICAK